MALMRRSIKAIKCLSEQTIIYDGDKNHIVASKNKFHNCDNFLDDNNVDNLYTCNFGKEECNMDFDVDKEGVGKVLVEVLVWEEADIQGMVLDLAGSILVT